MTRRLASFFTGGLNMRNWIMAVGLTLLAHGPVLAKDVSKDTSKDVPKESAKLLSPEAINAATFTGKLPAGDKVSALAIKVQVLLDRAHFSPGEIDGMFGDNVEKALQAFAEANGLPSG